MGLEDMKMKPTSCATRIIRISPATRYATFSFSGSLDQLTPAESFVLSSHPDPVYSAVQGATQHGLRKQRRIIFLA